MAPYSTKIFSKIIFSRHPKMKIVHFAILKLYRGKSRFEFYFILYDHFLYDSFTLCLGMKVFRCILDSRLSDFLWSTAVHNCRLTFHLPAVLCSSHVSSLHLLLKVSIQSPFLVVISRIDSTVC